MSAQRIQRRRVKGWRMPEGAVYVGRGSKWGNPFTYHGNSGLARTPAVDHPGHDWEYEGRISADGMRHDYHHSGGKVTVCHVRWMTRAELVECYRALLTGRAVWPIDFGHPHHPNIEGIADLRGKDLACWCPLEDEHGNQVPCHADVLLEIANRGDGQ